jgi:2-keto-4-pentenoate hydratase/2-oxohepta-3-ene-1,7-dioic acid hydratase in catechol pathway
MGPWITPLEQAGDPQRLGIKLWVGDELMQNSNSSELIHDLYDQVAYLSRHVTLYPGDVIATGTPAGVGRPRGRFLRPGDSVRIDIENLGELYNPVV